MASSAVALKEKGNTCFKAANFTGAIKFYSQAEASDPVDPIYPSNLSAAFYEQGKYFESYSAICRSRQKIPDGESNSALLSKLSTRLAKSLSCGVRSGAISLKDLETDIALINELRLVSESDSASPDCVRAWKDWKRVAHDYDRTSKGASQARTRLASLPVRKKTGEGTIEYYTVGQDELMSLVQDWGPSEKDKKNPVDLARMSEDRLSRLSFYFGGVGDARHVFGSVVGLSQARLKLNKRKRQVMRAHLTMNDIHPSALARDLCMLFLLDELSSNRDNEIKEAELKMTLLSIWMGLIMPSYCYIRLKKTIKALLNRLQSSPIQLPDWIYVVSASVPAIVASLKYWDTELGNKTAKELMAKRHNIEFSKDILQDASMSLNWKKDMAAKTEAKNEQIKMHIDMTMDDAQVIQLTRASMRTHERKEWLDKARKVLYDMMVKLDEGENLGTRGPASLLQEEAYHRTLGGFVPPSILRSRTAELDTLWTAVRGGEAPPDVIRNAQNHVDSTWKPNATLFDRIQERGTGYPDPQFAAINFVNIVEKFNKRMRLARGQKQTDPDCPSFSILSMFFDGVVEAIANLKGHLTLELLQGDLNEELVKMQNGDDVTRPQSFPRKYTRIWLSNVPDYTGGPLAQAVYSMRSLETAPDAALAANCLMNSGVWEGGDHFVHNYTQLNCKDYARFFGCRILTMDPAWGLMQYAQDSLPRPVEELPSRDELTTWLTRVLLNIITPSKTGSGTVRWIRVRFPNTLALFMGLLLRLHEIGYPSHWISEYLSSVINDTLATDIVPYLGDAPIPLSQMGRRGTSRRRINLDPWSAEFETIVALSFEAIPFPISLPEDFAQSYTDIGVFEAPCPTFGATTVMHMYGFDPVFTLVFYDETNVHLFSPVKENLIPEILEGRHVKKGQVYILTSVDILGLSSNVMRWRMSKERVRKMKAGKWRVMAYRADMNETSIFPDEAAKWREVNVQEVSVR
ncbi:hypothetical protein BDZ89DRAFT_1067865 [Hymenopellis radicata]|nr:hypothetical protein BDZ89DRAFT_1067865 [Hymenopellis radicata]